MTPAFVDRIKRALLVMAIGPLPAGIFVMLCIYNILSFEYFRGYFIVLGGLWGLTAGILRRSLLRALIGLNLGAGLAFTWCKYNDNLNSSFGILTLALTGAVLGSALSVQRDRPFKTSCVGSFFGAVALGALGCIALLVAHVAVALRLHKWAGLIVVIVIPLTTGAALFLWLLVDVAEHTDGPKMNKS